MQRGAQTYVPMECAEKTYRMCTRLRAQRGGSRMAYLLDALRCSVRHGASLENYFVLRFLS